MQRENHCREVLVSLNDRVLLEIIERHTAAACADSLKREFPGSRVCDDISARRHSDIRQYIRAPLSGYVLSCVR